MKYEQIPARKGKYVIKITDSYGAVGICASDVPAEALAGLRAKLLKRLAVLEAVGKKPSKPGK